MVHFSFSGHDFVAMPQGALYWPLRHALIVADMHFEKASWFAAAGQMLPPYDSLSTLKVLATLIEATNAREIWCLGDSFHDAAGEARLPKSARALLTDLILHCRWHWITGNHDERLAGVCGGQVMDEAIVDGIILRHEADTSDPRPELSGHFHPRLRVRLRGRRVARRCFIATQAKLILPAFGALTGGLDADHPAISRAVGSGAEALIALEDRLLRFPIAA